MRYFLDLSFKGTAFSGWQAQDNAPSVQQTVNEALATLAGETAAATGCCRTDAGVHAVQLVAHFDAPSELEPYKFLHQLNGLLPHGIAAQALHRVAPAAHARYDAVARTYGYAATRRKNPFLTDYAAGFYFDLDLDRIRAACALLPGHTDYRCFARQGGSSDMHCTVRSAEWRFENGLHRFTVTANRFLRGMVRALVGTLVEVGKGRLTPAQFGELLAGGNRADAGASVPACGLYLLAVDYPFIPPRAPRGLPGTVF
jgi:tRNA pseudouridine38-40 synthase